MTKRNGQQMSTNDRLKHLESLIRRMRDASMKLPSSDGRKAAAANADTIQWALGELTKIHAKDPKKR